LYKFISTNGIKSIIYYYYKKNNKEEFVSFVINRFIHIKHRN